MTLPSSGVITARMINAELGRAETAAFSITGSAERALAGKPTGAISFSDFRGKSNGRPLSWSGSNPATVTVSGATNITLTVQATGTVLYSYVSGQGGSGGSLGNWVTPPSFVNDGTQVRLTTVSGTTSASGTWVSLNSSSVTSSAMINSGTSARVRVEFRRNGGSVLLSFEVILNR